MDRKRNTKARGRKTLRQNSYTKIKGDNTSAIVNISRWRIAPPRMLVKLGFQEERTLANAASTNTSFRFTANGAYDLDPSVGNLTMNGFNQWMAIYGSYRVIHFKATLTFNNLSSFPIRIATGFFPQTHFPFLNTEFNSNIWCREEKTLGPLTGMGQLKVVRQVELAKLIGTAAYEGDLTQYYGTAASNPTSLASFNVAAYSTGGALMPLGVCIVTDIEMIVELSLPTPLLQV
jgi:hypothetical protein